MQDYYPSNQSSIPNWDSPQMYRKIFEILPEAELQGPRGCKKVIFWAV